MPHSHQGLLSMANAGPNTNGSQFFILFGPATHLNKKHTVFGRVISGYDFVSQIESNPTGAQDKPLKEVRIVDCGELTGSQKLEASKAEFLPSYIDVPMNIDALQAFQEHEDDSDGADQEAEDKAGYKGPGAPGINMGMP